MRNAIIATTVVGSVFLVLLVVLGFIYIRLRRKPPTSRPREFFDPDDTFPALASRTSTREAAVNPFLTVNSMHHPSETDSLDEDPGASAQPLMHNVSPPMSHMELPVVETTSTMDHAREEEELKRDWLRAHTILVMSNPDTMYDALPSQTNNKAHALEISGSGPPGADPSPAPVDQPFVNRVAEQLANLVLAQRIQDLTESPPSYVKELQHEAPIRSASPPASRDGHSPTSSAYRRLPSHRQSSSQQQEASVSPEARPLLSEPVSPTRRFGPRPMPHRSSAVAGGSLPNERRQSSAISYGPRDVARDAPPTSYTGT